MPKPKNQSPPAAAPRKSTNAERLERIETRLVRLMRHQGLDPNGDPLEKPHDKSPTKPA